MEMKLTMVMDQMRVVISARSISLLILLGCLLTGCAIIRPRDPGLSFPKIDATQAITCLITEPAWVKPPVNSAVSGSPEFGFYYVNEDRSILASAWWFGQEENYLRAGEEGIKMGWFRPAGAELEIIGRRIDAERPALETHVPCCYPTRFQAAGLIFPTEGCWEVTGKADARVLTFVVSVQP